MIRVAINGFGRIGRSVFRILDKKPDINVVAVNDLSDKESIAYLLKYDTIMGRFKGNVSISNNILTTDNQSVKIINEKNPTKLVKSLPLKPWAG